MKQDLNTALENYKKQYPSVTSADLQTFILGFQAANETTPTNTIQEQKGDWKSEIEGFYKISGKFSQNADLIRRVISKVDRERVHPLVESIKELRQQLQYMVNLSYPSANPTKSEIYHNIDLSNEVIKKSKEILP